MAALMANASSDSSSGSDSPSAVHQFDDLLDRLGTGDGVEHDLAAVVADNLGEDLEGLLPTMRLLAAIGKTSDFNAATASQGLDLRGVTLGDFRIRREIGRGGMGIVFEAIQLSLDRRVALKVLPIASTLDPKLLARFEREAQAAATLEHPNIVRAYARGEERGIYYLAMQFVPGQDLSQFIQSQQELGSLQGFPESVAAKASTAESDVSAATTFPDAVETKPPSSSSGSFDRNYYRQVARVGMQAAEAIQFAHERGIIHRDIKPSNLLLDPEGDLWIADFGLATLDVANQVTATGKVLGTLRYSSPEQLRSSRDSDRRTDVYSLGVTLYELATLQPAFANNEPGKLLQTILETEPIRPRKLTPRLPQDLESVILKAMAKEPRHRYYTALELAADLDRFLRNEPVLAKRPTAIERGLRWVQRNRAISLMAAALTVLILAGVVGVVTHFARQNEVLTRLHESNSHLTRTMTELNHTLSQEQQLRKEVAAEEQVSRELFYVADLSNILRLAEGGQFDLLRQRLQRHFPQPGREDMRGFLWRYLHSMCNEIEVTLTAHQHEVLSTAFAPKLKLLATGDKRGTIHIWDTMNWEQRRSLSFVGEVCALDFSHDEKLIAVGGSKGMIDLYETDEWELVRSISAHDMTTKGLKFTPDGETLISASRAHDIAYWDTRTWKGERRFIAHDTVQNLSMSQDGHWLASGGDDGVTKVWNVESGDLVMESKGHELAVLCTALSSDGQLVASGGYDEHVCLTDCTTGEQLAILERDTQAWSLCFCQNDSRLIVGTGNGETQEFDISDPRAPQLLRLASVHSKNVRAMELLVDADQIVTVSDDTTILVSARPEQRVARRRSVPNSRFVLFAPDAERFAVAHLDGRFSLFDRTGIEIKSYQNLCFNSDSDDFGVPQLAFARDGALWAANVEERYTHFTVVQQTGSVHAFTIEHEDDLTAVWLSSDAQHALSVDADNRGVVWSLDGPNQVTHFDVPPSIKDVAFSCANTMLALATNSGDVLVVDWASGQTKKTQMAKASVDGFYSVALNSSDSLVAAGGWEGVMFVWDTESGELRNQFRHLKDHRRSSIKDVEFSDNGRYLVSAGHDLRLWQVETGQFIAQIGPAYIENYFECLAFSPNDDCLIAVADQPEHSDLHIWDTRGATIAAARRSSE